MPNQYNQQETHFFTRRDQYQPPSPPMEEQKCSLPSISNLLGLADAGSPTSESSPTSRQHSPRFEVPPPSHGHSRAGSEWAKSSHRGLPPTPPMSTDASFEGYSSPTRKPSNQAYPGSAPRKYYYETTPPLEADAQRQASVTAIPRATPPATAPYPQQAHPTVYANPAPVGAYYPAAQVPPAVQPQEMNPYYQRPLPQAYPPPVSMPAPAPSGANPWQHHHYLNPTGAAAFPQSQDRRRRGGNWLENLAKHHARRLVYYCMLFYRHTKRSTDESRRDGDGERRIRYAQDQGGYGAMNIKILQDQSTIVARDEDVNPEPCRHEK
ncbi:hypothetical protein BKA60DRAFT_671244 [Fusarium oxysporum]|nr:hypothetical protein BKA60DRAFT_671244 [Fusarium oxysporum]